ncbi:MAG TPA: error-prone DNA polymerase [Myxococcota bacterium]|nr:error-prone DNA polymerase [Myxococcota bacterium]HQK52537.1 error-prone DNA polymerase [Myxococcota bacterium]
MAGAWVPLWCKSHASLLEGASAPEDLVERAHALGLPALALTDRDSVQGLPQAWVRARALGVRLIPGAEVTMEDGSPLVLLAASRTGWGHLCRLLTLAWGSGVLDGGSSGPWKAPRGPRASWAQVAVHAEGLVALWGGPASALARPGGPSPEALAIREAFGDRLYALVTRSRQEEEVPAEARLRRQARRLGLPVVAGVEVLYDDPVRRPLQDLLTAIRHQVPLEAAGRLLRANDRHALWSTEVFRDLFADDPAAVDRSREVADRCAFSLADLRYRYPVERLPEGATTASHLRDRTWEGARERHGGRVPDDVRAQLERELALIEELDYGGYFLTMHEIVRWCRQQGILCQGRGSAANSAVCYCLGITAVDPVRMGLLFERFLSRERAEPPDIDLDIAHHRREEVIQHVYRTYGRDRAAMVANVVRFRPRSAIREAGKALGLPPLVVDRMARLASHWDPPEDDLYRAAGLDPQTGIGRVLRDRVQDLLGVPRHLSIHPGGFLLGHDPVCDLVPIQPAAMEGRTVIQWDKDDVEALGLFKVDLLGLGALTQVDLCLDLVRHHRGLDLDLSRVPPDDPATFEMLCRGDTVGVFQLESRAQMATLPRLRPRTWYDLVIEISIVRPGPIAGQMFHPYLRRRQGLEPVEFPHPSLRPVLEKTLGVPLFQEQVMRLAVVAADYTPGEADQLRRDMAAWRRGGRIEAHRDRLISRMIQKGIAPEFAERVFQQIRGFGEYGFPESHAASFALICQATAWLRRHFLPEFICALLNAQPMGFYSVATIVQDARRHGLEVRPVDVRHSDWDCTLEETPGGPHPFGVRMGLRLVQGLGPAHRKALEAAPPPYSSLEDFVDRTGLPAGALEALARAGAFEGFGLSRREALWALPPLVARRNQSLPLAGGRDTAPELPPLSTFETLTWDHRHAGHSPRGHLLEPLRPLLRSRGLLAAAEVQRQPDGAEVQAAGLVICRQRPVNAGGVVFLTLEDETGFLNVVLFREVQQRPLWKTAALLGVSGRLQVQDGVAHLVARALFPVDLPLPALVESRDWR